MKQINALFPIFVNANNSGSPFHLIEIYSVLVVGIAVRMFLGTCAHGHVNGGFHNSWDFLFNLRL
jgi:hypothetical protein